MDWKIKYICVKFCGNCIHIFRFIMNFMENLQSTAHVGLASNISYKTWITKVQKYANILSFNSGYVLCISHIAKCLYEQGVIPHFSTEQNLLKKILRKDKY